MLASVFILLMISIINNKNIKEVGLAEIINFQISKAPDNILTTWAPKLDTRT